MYIYVALLQRLSEAAPALDPPSQPPLSPSHDDRRPLPLHGVSTFYIAYAMSYVCDTVVYSA